MPNQTTLQVIAGIIPQGFCPQGYQDILNMFSSQQTVVLPPSASSLQVSQTKPADTTLPWLQLDSLGRPVRIYLFAQGAWLSLHPDFPGKTIIYTGPLPDFTIFDGGDSNSIGPYSGAMWQLSNTQLDGSGTPNLSGRAPMGVGTFPSGATITLNQQLGEDVHNITLKEMFPHQHAENIAVNLAVPDGGSVRPDGTGAFVGAIGNGGTELLSKIVGGDPTTGNPATNSLAHNTLSPVTGVYFLQRTSRLFYSVT